MNLKKLTKPIVILLVLLIAGFVALKITKRSYHYVKEQIQHINEPQRWDAQKQMFDLKGPTISDDIKIFTASSLDRIFKDGKTLLKPNYSTSVEISAAHHEYESFQIVVYSAQKNLTRVFLKASDLVNSTTGEMIKKNNIELQIVGYVPTQKPYYPVKFIGPWPDPLLPLDAIDIKAGQTQPFWVTVYVPKDAVAGNYQGTISVTADGLTVQTIPVSLHVYNFTLPRESHLKTAFDFYGYLTKARYPQGEKENDDTYKERINGLNDQYIIEMLKYRMNPVLNIDPTSQYDLSSVDRYLTYGLNNFSIGKKGGTFDNNWPKSDDAIEELQTLYQTYAEDLKINKMLQYTYIYTWDEGDMGNPQVSRVAAMIHHAYPGLKNMVCYHGIWDIDQGPDWIKDIDIWTFQIDNFDEAKMRKLQKAGKEMWMYISGPSGTGSPNLAMDFDSIDYRIVPWLCWKYDIRGFLYWCVNWWPTVNPFENAKNSKWEQNGNGLLFYPGKNGPLVSLRMKVFRDGMEDYEYIQLLLERLRYLKQNNLDKSNQKLFDESMQLLKMDNSIIEGMDKFNRDGESLKARRNAIAEKIEEFDKLGLIK